MLPFACAERWRQRALLRRHWPVLMQFALPGIGNDNTVAYPGLQIMTATKAVLLTSVTPVVIRVVDAPNVERTRN